MLCALVAYICMETSDVQHIIRIRSRMIASSWLVLSSSLLFMHPLGGPAICAVCLAMSYDLLFRCYQLYNPTVWVFHSFLFLGIGSIFAPVFAAMALLYYIYLVGFLRALTWRGFWAGLLGLVLPYWCWAAWCFLMDKTEDILGFVTSHFMWSDVSWQAIMDISLAWKVSAGIVILLSLVALFHYLQTRYNDKIKIRMILYIYTLQTILLILYLILQPKEFQNTMSLLLVSSCPLIAHYFALSKSWLSNAFFIFSLLLCGVMAYYNLWMP